MKSLYDLLGARENDDADALKKAFHKAVKAHHPDLHPNDPPAVERFTEIIAANALLRDEKQRATYDWLLQRERESFQLMLRRRRLRSTLARQQFRSKRSRTIAVIAAVSALIGGYGLWATMPMTSNVEIDNDALAAAAGAAVEKQTATVIAAARENENPPTAIAAAKSDAVKGNGKGNVDNAGKPVGTTGAKAMAPTDAPDQGQPRDKRDGMEVLNGANKSSADKHEDTKVLNDVGDLSDDAAAIMRSVMQRLRDGGDATATAGPELALGPPAAHKHKGAEVLNGAMPSADKREDAKVLNEVGELSDDAAAIMRSVMQRLRDDGDAQATAGRKLALGPPANDTSFYRERGIAAYASGDFLGAISNFDEAIRLNPNDAQSYNIRGNVWDEMGAFESAFADYDEAIRIDPNNPAVFHDRAIMWQHKGELDKALIDLDRAIRFSFSDARMYCDRGLVWYETGHHDRAIADFDRAIKVDSSFAAAYINRGLILHRNGEFNVAFADSKAIRIDPGLFDVNRRTNSLH